MTLQNTLKALHTEYLQLSTKAKDAQEQATEAQIALDAAIQHRDEAWEKYYAVKKAVETEEKVRKQGGD